MRKKLFWMLLSAIMIVMLVPLTATAQGNDFKNTVYNYILDDYLQTTHLEKDNADAMFTDLKNNGFDTENIKKVESIIYSDKRQKTKYEDNVLFIQENYDNIIKGVSSKEKNIIDKYFLNYAIKYYEDYGSPDDFVEPKISPRAFKDAIEPKPFLMDNDVFESQFVDKNEVVVPEKIDSREKIGTLETTKVASVRIFSDPTESTVGCSLLQIDLGTHAWLTISNISSSNITIGKFSIPAGKTLSLGTWGNKSEHKGLWYNLESYFVYHKDSAYSGRVSLRCDIGEANLNTLNSYMIGYDTWSELNNCSSFASKSWNKICSYQLSAGVINTPKNLANSIKGNSDYYSGFPVPYHYAVYYANGNNSPIRSEEFKES